MTVCTPCSVRLACCCGCTRAASDVMRNSPPQVPDLKGQARQALQSAGVRQCSSTDCCTHAIAELLLQPIFLGPSCCALCSANSSCHATPSPSCCLLLLLPSCGHCQA